MGTTAPPPSRYASARIVALRFLVSADVPSTLSSVAGSQAQTENRDFSRIPALLSSRQRQNATLPISLRAVAASIGWPREAAGAGLAPAPGAAAR